ncbi:HD-GYP domain-containing protein [Evansella clarkii]|jgi:putative nucleotidyltransferase with HDIG domain|uniref:HD-GYP domain-containing protein n=1 Tax=Evansella clarkii TaxID=79879 RepID=UPI0009969334|nr:HD domain-containing phosphohydrolase [Evansella clarkii]
MTNKRTPESLFEDISQDNEVLREFKHHSWRVMYLSAMLGKKAGCYSDDLRVAALLHDIGKMALSKEILFKPGRLNSLEKTIVETHCYIGNRIVRKELGKTHAAEYIRDHHENWDGTGYPRGLTGENITVEGRVIRICDSFDTMTYDLRNYSKVKKTREEAFTELRECSWSQFDGNLVENFIELLSHIELPENWYHNFDSKFLENVYGYINKPEDFL